MRSPLYIIKRDDLDAIERGLAEVLEATERLVNERDALLKEKALSDRLQANHIKELEFVEQKRRDAEAARDALAAELEMWRTVKHSSPRLEIVEAANAELLAALKRADQFITNGIELGYIRMPDAGTPDPAHETPSIIRSALARHAALGSPREPVAWQPIETAPKDRTEILLHGVCTRPSIDAGKPATVIGYWTDHNSGGWVWYGAAMNFTHWIPLPAAPRSGGSDAHS